MAIEKAKEFLLALKEKGADEAWTAKAAEAKTEEEKYALAAEMAKEAGFDVTVEEIKEALIGLEQEGNDLRPLDEAEVEGVAGGVSDMFDIKPGDTATIYCFDCEDFVEATKTDETDTRYLFFKVYGYKCHRCGNINWKLS